MFFFPLLATGRSHSIVYDATVIEMTTVQTSEIAQSVKWLITSWATGIRLPAGTDFSLRHHSQTESGDNLLPNRYLQLLLRG
jgi:hypothetical protein